MADERTIAENSRENSRNCAKKFQYIDKNRYDARDFLAPDFVRLSFQKTHLTNLGKQYGA
jgi:hypothetical protein